MQGSYGLFSMTFNGGVHARFLSWNGILLC